MISRVINNLRVRHKDIFAKWEVITLSNNVIKEFDRWEDAINFCYESEVK